MRVAVQPENLEKALDGAPDVVVVNSATRECPPADAAQVVAGICGQLAGLSIGRLFKKIDSRMRGNIATELAALRRLGITRAVVAPAIPEFGRISDQGILSGAGLPEPVDMAQRLEGCGLNLDFPHISGPEDFARIEAFPPADTALVGARGLGAALAGPARAKAPPVFPAPLLAAIGSRDPVSRAQIADFTAAMPHGAAIAEAPGGTLAAPLPAADRTLIHMSAAPDAPFDPDTANARFAATVSAACVRQRTETLFLCGGETALAALDMLGIEVLEPVDEFVPGVPVSHARHKGRRLTLVTKSGGFGHPGLLRDLFRNVTVENALPAK